MRSHSIFDRIFFTTIFFCYLLNARSSPYVDIEYSRIEYEPSRTNQSTFYVLFKLVYRFTMQIWNSFFVFFLISSRLSAFHVFWLIKILLLNWQNCCLLFNDLMQNRLLSCYFLSSHRITLLFFSEILNSPIQNLNWISFQIYQKHTKHRAKGEWMNEKLYVWLKCVLHIF